MEGRNSAALKSALDDASARHRDSPPGRSDALQAAARDPPSATVYPGASSKLHEMGRDMGRAARFILVYSASKLRLYDA